MTQVTRRGTVSYWLTIRSDCSCPQTGINDGRVYAYVVSTREYLPWSVIPTDLIEQARKTLGGA